MKKMMTVMIPILIVILLLVNTFLLMGIVGNRPFRSNNIKDYAGHWVASGNSDGAGLYIFEDGTVALVATEAKRASVEDPYDAYITNLYLGYFEKGNVIFTKYYAHQKYGLLKDYYYHQIDEIPGDEFNQWADIYYLEKVGNNALKMFSTAERFTSYVRGDDNE